MDNNIKNDEKLEIHLPNFIHKLVLYEKNNFVGLNIHNEIIKYFKIIDKNPNFLISYIECKKMSICVPSYFKYYKDLYRASFKLYMEYCLLILTNSYISNCNDFEASDCFEFKDYVVEIHDKNSGFVHNYKVINAEKYSNVYIANEGNPDVIPIMDNVNTFSDLVILEIKKIINLLCDKFSSLYDSTWRNETTNNEVNDQFDNIISSYSKNKFLLPENIAKVITYPFNNINKKWFENIIGKIDVLNENYPKFMHAYIMNIKYGLKYNNGIIEYYEFIKKYEISKQKQNILLEKISKNPNQKLYVNTIGDICEYDGWALSDIFQISLKLIAYINIDILISSNKIRWEAFPDTIELLKKCGIHPTLIEWIIPKLKTTNFSNTNVYDILNLYNSKVKVITPTITDMSFTVLKLNFRERNIILKQFLEFPGSPVYVDLNNKITDGKPKVGLIAESIPKIYKILFLMRYCLLCEKSKNSDILTCAYNYMEMRSVQPVITQPHYCNDCFDLVKLIKCPIKTLNQTRINFNKNIIDLSFIREKFKLIILGSKYEHNSTLNILVMDILQTIVSSYISSINF